MDFILNRQIVLASRHLFWAPKKFYLKIIEQNTCQNVAVVNLRKINLKKVKLFQSTLRLPMRLHSTKALFGQVKISKILCN
jgi:hypothetical protein